MAENCLLLELEFLELGRLQDFPGACMLLVPNQYVLRLRVLLTAVVDLPSAQQGSQCYSICYPLLLHNCAAHDQHRRRDVHPIHILGRKSSGGHGDW